MWPDIRDSSKLAATAVSVTVRACLSEVSVPRRTPVHARDPVSLWPNKKVSREGFIKMAVQKGAKSGCSCRRRREHKNVDRGAAHIQSTFNNTIVTITDTQGNAISWASSGELGFRNSEKSTPLPRRLRLKPLPRRLQLTTGMKSVEVLLKGPGSGREAAIHVRSRARALRSA